MGLTRKEVLKLIGAGAGTAAVGRMGLAALPEPAADTDPTAYSPDAIITRDVCVIGGGSSGTYGAIALRDLGKSVVVVESNDRLGGHTHTYTDPATGAKNDYGVIAWHDLPIVHSYFDRFNIPLVRASFAATGPSEYVDYRTGKVVGGYTPSDPSAALQAYAAQLSRYPYLELGFDLPDPVPAELLLPFGDFVKKYALDAAVNTIFNFGQGLGDLLRQPTLYVMKNFGLDTLANVVAGSFLTTARHDNSELYQKARTELGADALLRSRVVATDRDASGYANILVQTPSGLRIIRAKKILVTIPPKVDNLVGFDLDATELSLFRQFGNSAYYTGLLRNTGIPDNLSVNNIGADTPYHLPALPGVYSISPSGIPGVHSVKYGSPVQLSETQVRANILADIKRLRAAGSIPTPTSPTPPEFAVFASHSPFEVTVPTSAIKSGFYRKLYALQGRNRTFYSGAAFHTHDSTLLWRFTEALLPRIAA